MRIKTLSAGLAFLLMGAAAGAQDKPRKPPTPLKVQVVLSRFHGDKKIASLPYALSVAADDRPSKLRIGAQVPMPVSPGTPSSVYKSVGSSLDCWAEALEEGRYKVNLTLEQSSVHPEDAQRMAATGSASPPPTMRSFTSESTLLLRDGQTSEFTAATDPVSGEMLKVGVTLNVLK